MNIPQKRWVIAPAIPPEAEGALDSYPPIVRQILFNRGFSTPEAAQSYLEARMPPETDPYLLLGMDIAVDRIRQAIKEREKIAVYGDYDVDGVTATALLVETFENLGADVQGYIPNRFDEGYGLNSEALDSLVEQGVRLVITVDCGIRSINEVEHANKIGLDVIITDHHHPYQELPPALSILNPKQLADHYAHKDLAGVGLAYKLAAALFGGDREADTFLDLVALGTVADLAPLAGENRSLVRKGIEMIRQTRRQGLMALLGASGLESARITAADIGYILGPRLNAAGRLDSALAALSLLTTRDTHKAAQLAQFLDNQNRKRQEITREIQQKAEQIALSRDPDPYLLFAVHPDFNPGVVGLAASKLVETYYRPAIVAHQGEGFVRGSCRSIPEFHITQALDQCADLMEHHGGHAAAAGFTIREANLPILFDRLSEIAAEQLAEIDLRHKLYADIEVPLAELRPELLRYLFLMQPTGYGNRQAHFVSRNLKVTSKRKVGRDGNHLKLTVTDGRITYDAIAFGLGYWYERMPAKIDLLYSFELNEFNGRVTLQLNIRDIKATSYSN